MEQESTRHARGRSGEMIALEEMVLPGAEVESEILEFLGEAGEP